MKGVSVPVTYIINSESDTLSDSLSELWRQRALLFPFTVLNVRRRYGSLFLGVLLTVLKPLTMASVSTFVFGSHFSKTLSELPFFVSVFSGWVFWQFFSQGFSLAGSAVRNQKQLIKQVYFPLILLPFSLILSYLIDLTLGVLILFALFIAIGIPLPLSSLWALPFSIWLLSTFTFAVSLWTNLIDLRFPQARYLVPVVMQLLFVSSPVFYPASIISESWRGWYLVNPIAASIEILRCSLSGRLEVIGSNWVAPSLLTIFLLASGITLFLKKGGTIAENL